VKDGLPSEALPTFSFGIGAFAGITPSLSLSLSLEESDICTSIGPPDLRLPFGFGVDDDDDAGF
jgi:hypothetical protein